MQETQVRSLGWKDPLKEEMATLLQYSCLENSMDRGAYSPQGHRELDTTEHTHISSPPHTHTHTFKERGFYFSF